MIVKWILLEKGAALASTSSTKWGNRNSLASGHKCLSLLIKIVLADVGQKTTFVERDVQQL